MQYKFIIHNYSKIQDAIKSTQTNVPLEHILGIYNDFSVDKICKPELVNLYKRFYKLFLYYYNGTIDFTNFSKETINLINTDDLSYLIFWATHEPHNYWNTIETQLQSCGINLDKVVFVSSDQQPGSKYKHVFADNWWEAYYRYHVKTNSNVSIRAPLNTKITDYNKKALCLNRNLRPFRVWNYFALVTSGLESQSHVSYHLPNIKEDQLKYSKIIPFEFEDCVEIAQKEIPEQLRKKFRIF